MEESRYVLVEQARQRNLSAHDDWIFHLHSSTELEQHVSMKTLVHLVFTPSEPFSVPPLWPFVVDAGMGRSRLTDIEYLRTMAACRIGIKAGRMGLMRWTGAPPPPPGAHAG